ncbi:aromatic ring-hydroxylating dioxygenase subunit alpha [Roseovarius sp. SCSIO 43702]|uniref:aromatic ring-hydroxylating oxygenase subunit alpha n=1 Tax=Roseovarius sp. SCSIO 43702 TaxID=2823043 RepID=UPI001C730226|nr:aromatic ring-hydroxylating dioxygenase subunit alpha [Roseovarius sp. SCSIO 43702]QYX57058.1 aromatic ring-hydroxylating dioxygenase subunit alpha [Roseovarius sp. SCSIO 43702]
MDDHPVLETEFNGLSRSMPSLPAAWYRDPAHHARELELIWGRNWIYLCRSETLDGPRSFRTFEVAGQPVLLLRNAEGALRGFLNTCRHRGSILCQKPSGTLEKPLLVCPYHQWAYDLSGALRATGPMRPVDGFDRADHPLLSVSVAEWGGFVFVNLDPSARSFDELYGDETAYVDNWPLADLRVGHSYTKQLKCNWKVFWENYNECLHCPNIHPELSNLVPIYGRAIMARRDDPSWSEHPDDPAPRASGGLREGAETWSMDGRAQGRLAGVTDDDLDTGQRYVTVMPSIFIAHHADYVRTVQIIPTGPEEMTLTADWLFDPEMQDRPDFDPARITDFGKLVMEQDGAACELNQAGLASRRFDYGVLMQEEYEVFLFQDWVRRQLGEPALGEAPASRASRRRKEDR